MSVLEWVFTIYNVLVLFLYGYDKIKSKKGGRRISEETLLLLGFCFGAMGALLAMELFGHKTKHRRFWVCHTLFLLLQLGLIGFYLFRS